MRHFIILDDNNILQKFLVEGVHKIPSHAIEITQVQKNAYFNTNFYKYAFIDGRWIEGATQQEIDEMTKPQPTIPSEMELLKEELMLLKSEKDALAETLDMLLTEIIPNLTGGI